MNTVQLLPEPAQRAQSTAADDSHGGTADVPPAQLALSLQLTAPAPARSLKRWSSRSARRDRVHRAPLPMSVPLGLGPGSGLPPPNMAGIMATSSKVRLLRRKPMYSGRLPADIFGDLSDLLFSSAPVIKRTSSRAYLSACFFASSGCA